MPGKPTDASPGETVLIVDDESSVRQTLQEWLAGAGLGCRILTAADAEAALVLANEQTIDLAVLDWNLGAGNDGLQLLEDLAVFNPDVVAILITGYAHQATPLDALRMGVRDYLDKSQHFDRDTFIASVRRQLDRVRPAKRERRLHQSLVAFRSAVEKVLPLVQSAAALNDPLPLPEAIGSLFRLLLRMTGATAGALLVRTYDEARQPAEVCRAYDETGTALTEQPVSFARSVAGSVVSLQEPSVLRLDDATAIGGVELQPFERGRRVLLAAPLAVGPGLHVVLELFDKPDRDFDEADRQLVAAAADLGAEMLRQSLAGRQTHRVLLDAVAAALGAADHAAETLRGDPRPEEPPPADVLDRLRAGVAAPGSPLDADATLRLAEAVRVLAVRHGPAAVRHCTRLVESLRELLDSATGG